MKDILRVFLIIFWFIGNMMIFSTIIYIKIGISGYVLDTFLIVFIMIMWVFGQVAFANPKFVEERRTVE